MTKVKTKKQKIKETYYVVSDLFRVNKKLNNIRKVLHVAMVFFGFILAYYGVWSFVSATWPLNIPIVAIVLGVSLLYVNGRTNTLG